MEININNSQINDACTEWHGKVNEFTMINSDLQVAKNDSSCNGSPISTTGNSEYSIKTSLSVISKC